MNNKNLRNILRWIHLVVAFLIGVYFYSPVFSGAMGGPPPPFEGAGFLLLMRVLVLPVALVTGLWMWQMPRVRKWLARTPSRTVPETR
jgi:hypothetical protein